MKTEQKIRDVSLVLINILVWFEILWAVVFLVGMVFQWTGLTDQLATAFFGCGVCAGLVLIALNVLNFTANLNIISKAQAARATNEPISQLKAGSFLKPLAAAFGLIGIIVLLLWFTERRLYQKKAQEASAKIESIAETKLAQEAISLIYDDVPIKELAKVREALSANIQSGSRLSIIFPEKVKGVELYAELTAWWYGGKDSDRKISDAGLPRFIPSAKEQKRFEQMVKGELAAFTVRKERSLRAFRRVASDRGQIILLLDTSRRSDYSSGSF